MNDATRLLAEAKPTHIAILRRGLHAWTVFTTTFLWTPTMRLLLKPEISQWRVFGLGGEGTDGPYLFLPFLALLALVMFYIDGRGRARNVFYVLLLAWHGGVTSALIVGALTSGNDAVFMGAAWGIRFPLALLIVPFAVSTVAAIALWIVEHRLGRAVPVFGWLQVQKGKLGVAALALPCAALFFWLGEGFDVYTLTAIVFTILQWVLLTEGVGRPPH
ncbi:MAG: hypothetical protein OER22_04275 [Gammaproteobacteria bacterium]|nr:hypothetical protein [Gammaproteobacteria bacterium]MDH3372672.1 hypothetical protein [Gammaproteobacteria bacterium]MDH3408586.1 hypothetical protein [Gammaproteobacteria bacterium]MDH3551811.1 hypothetical protein [Gammaproteobacteria bacterium]